MLTVDEQVCEAAPDVCFQVAADVEEWPRILSHYRWVRFRRKDSFATGLVEMAAWRPFGVFRYPTWWASEMTHDEDKRIVRYRHVQGVTAGMDVIWSVAPIGDDRALLRIVHEWDGPPWPLIGALAAEWVIGPGFIHHIAQRTLAGVAAEAERRRGDGR